MPPALRRKADEIDHHKPSKQQIKNEKKAERKKKKQKSRNSINSILNNQLDTAGVPLETKSDSESDADVEDNIDVS